MRTRMLACLLASGLTLAACGTSEGRTEFARRDLSKPPNETGGPVPIGHVAYQPPFLPVAFSIDATGKFSLTLTHRLVTPLGTLSVSGGVVVSRSSNEPLPPAPADVTQLIICRNDGDRSCEGYQLGTGRRLRIDMAGKFVQVVEHNRITIEAGRGSTIVVQDDGPSTDTPVPGPARLAIENDITLEEFGTETEVDLERSRSGTTPDLAYNHISGDLILRNGAQVSIVKVADKGITITKDDLPNENECLQRTDWADSFGPDTLKKIFVACIKTAEGDLGYVIIWPHGNRPPVELEFYSLIWVR